MISISAAVLMGLLGLSHAASAAGSEVYIEQAHGHGTTAMAKPTPEMTAQPGQQPAAAAPAPTAPDTCNAQNAASSQACYAATQQARPASH